MHSMAPAKVIWIYREEVKPARGASHEKVESGYARLWERAKVEPYLGLDSVSGDNESLFVAGYDSFAAVDKDFKTINEISSGPLKSDYDALAAKEAGLVDNVHSSIAVFRQDLSYLSDRFMDRLPKSRYVQVERFQVRPGHDRAFSDGAKMYQDAYRQLNIEEPWLVYQLVSGAPFGTYLVFVSMDSLSDMDNRLARESRIEQVMGDKMKNMDEGFISMQSNIYSLNPKTSYVTQEFAAADPSFWGKSSTSGSLARADISSDPAVISRMQTALNSLGYDCGTPDGVAGPQTRSALRRFQKDKGLPATGTIDRDTSEKLGI